MIFIFIRDVPILRDFLPAAFFTNAIQDDSFGVHSEIILDLIRDPNVIELIAVKIENFSAFDAMKMMVVFHIGIETPRPSLGGNNIDQSDLCKSQQRPVHRVVGYVGKFFFHDREHFIGCGMIFCLGEFFIYRAALRGDLQIEFFAKLDEGIEAIDGSLFLHIIIK
jgi:hypothetical protein